MGRVGIAIGNTDTGNPCRLGEGGETGFFVRVDRDETDTRIDGRRERRYAVHCGRPAERAF